jgi:TIR domain
MSHVFISYVRQDYEMVDRLVTSLRSHGIDVWIDREQIKPGERWQTAIKNAIREGAYFLACFSTASQARARSYMNEELTLAIDELRMRPAERRWFVPVLLSDCPVPERPIGAGTLCVTFSGLVL